MLPESVLRPAAPPTAHEPLEPARSPGPAFTPATVPDAAPAPSPPLTRPPSPAASAGGAAAPRDVVATETVRAHPAFASARTGDEHGLATRAAQTYFAAVASPAPAGRSAAALARSAPRAGESPLDAARRIAAERSAAEAYQPKARPRIDDPDNCGRTLIRLATRREGLLSASVAVALEKHLSRCLPCQAIELKEARAARAFVAMYPAGTAAVAAPAPAQNGAAARPAAARSLADITTVRAPRAPAAAMGVADARPRVVESRHRRTLAIAGGAATALAVGVTAALVAGGGSAGISAKSTAAALIHTPGPRTQARAPAPPPTPAPSAKRPSHRTPRRHASVTRRAAAHRHRPQTAPAAPAAATVTPAPALPTHSTTAAAVTPPPARITPTTTTAAPRTPTRTAPPTPRATVRPASSVSAVRESGLGAEHAPTQKIGHGGS